MELIHRFFIITLYTLNGQVILRPKVMIFVVSK